MSLPRSSLLDILSTWSPWGTASLRPGVPRQVTPRLKPFLDTPEAVALIGPRRAGKTTVMFQVMESLKRSGVPAEAILHVNLEEPALAPDLDELLLDRVYRLYRTEIHPTGRAWVFLDEVQRVPGWERWVRARSDSEDLKVFVTGSSAQLMSRELATLLTGRHVAFRVMPLDFREFLRFRSIAVPEKPRFVGTPPEMENALRAYLRWGGFPAVVLADGEERKAVLLKQYFDDILFKDVALRHQVRDLPTLRSLAVHLLTQTANLVTLKRLAGIFGVSLDLARTYCSHLEEAFLLSFSEFFSLKTGERLRRPRKVHAVDLGLRNAVALTGSPDHGRLAESAVWNALDRGSHDGLYYWQGKGEVDVAVRQANQIRSLVQVTYALEEEEVRRREIAALREAAAAFPNADAALVVGQGSDADAETDDLEVDVAPLWRFLVEQAGPRPREPRRPSGSAGHQAGSGERCDGERRVPLILTRALAAVAALL